MRPAKFVYPASDDDGIALAQTTAGAGPLIINGALLDMPATQQDVRRAILGEGIERVVTLTSAGNLAGINFTITGLNTRLEVVTETIAGPNVSTVSTTLMFMTVTSVTANAAVGSAVSVGTGAAGRTRWFMTDHFQTPCNVTLGLVISGTANVTVQNTLVDVNAANPAAGEIFDHPSMAGLTASAEGNYAFPPRFVRAVMNSGNGAFDFTIIQAG